MELRLSGFTLLESESKNDSSGVSEDASALEVEREMECDDLVAQRFDKLADCKAFLISHTPPVPLLGIEILPEAVSLSAMTVPQRIAIMPGNEGSGMSKAQKAVCDGFVYIPQYGNGTASLNVTVATTIVMHHIYSAHTQEQHDKAVEHRDSEMLR